MANIIIPSSKVKYVDNNNNDKNKFVDDKIGKYLSIFGEKRWYYTQTVIANVGTGVSIGSAGDATVTVGGQA